MGTDSQHIGLQTAHVISDSSGRRPTSGGGLFMIPKNEGESSMRFSSLRASKRFRIATVTVVTGAAVAVGIGSAFASSSGTISTITSTGVSFTGGSYYFYSPGGYNGHGPWEFSGYLNDTNSGDGNNVYIKSHIEGYGENRWNGTQKKSVWLDELQWSDDERYVEDAYIRACRNRGSLSPDNCSPNKHYTYNGS